MGNVTTEKLTFTCKADDAGVTEIDQAVPVKLLETLQFFSEVVAEDDAEFVLECFQINCKPGEDMILDEFVS